MCLQRQSDTRTQWLHFCPYNVTRGRSVIDYVCVPFDCLNQCLEFKVNAARDMINLHCNIDDIDTDLSKMIPDHSILTLKFSTHRVPVVNMPSEPADQVQRGQYDQTGGNTAYDQNHIYFKRYGVKNIPEDFLNNENSRYKLLNLIQDIEHTRGLQNEIDEVYAIFCTLYHDEMNRLLQSKNVHPKVYKRFKRSTKPFWKDHLSSLWKTLCEKEKLFLLCSDRRRRYLQQKFVLAQKKFDREYRKAERKYRKNKIDEIDNYCTSDPNKFWDSIKRLGPRSE